MNVPFLRLYNKNYIIFSSHLLGVRGFIEAYHFVNRYVQNREGLWLYSKTIGLPQAFFIVDLNITSVKCDTISTSAVSFLENHQVVISEMVKVVDKLKDKSEESVRHIADAHAGVEYFFAKPY